MMRAFTARQREVLEFVCAGYRHKEIATRLGLREQTIANTMTEVRCIMGIEAHAPLSSVIACAKATDSRPGV